MALDIAMDFIQQLKASVDIVRVVQDYVRLRKVGHRFTGLCPFHSEKTPSFSVTPDLQFFYCHGCHAGGDVLAFLMRIESLSFFEARNLLAERNGIPLPKRSEFTDDDSKLRAAIYRMHEVALEEFRSQLHSPQGAEARAYIARRGIAPDMVESFALGYAGKSLLRTFEQQGFTKAQTAACGLVGKREDGSLFDLFRNRLMFPIHNESGKVIAFGGRALDPGEKAKYINSPETPIYKKKTVLYNLHRAREAARKSDRMILVEGYMDVIAVYSAGLQDVVAPCGTAFTREQAQTIKRHSQNIIVNFDPDSAGSNAAEKSIQMLLSESMRIHVVQLDGGLDPDEYCKQHGPQAYAEAVLRAKTYFYWLADRARNRFDMRSAEGRVDAFNFLLPAVQGLTDRLERVAVANDVAGYLGVSTGLVLDNFRKMAADKREPKPVQEQVSYHDHVLLRLLVADEEAREQILPHLKPLAFVQQSPARRIYEALIVMHETGVPFSFSSLHERLDDADRRLLSIAVIATESAEVTLEQGLACLEALHETHGNTRVVDLKTRIRESERKGDMQEALRLMKLL